MCTLRIQYHIQYASRPYSGWLSRFRWLFYHFNIFYSSKYTELCQNLTWWSKSKYYDYDQNIIIMCSLRIHYHIRYACRPYSGWLSRCRWLFYHFNIFYWPKYTELCQNLISWSKSKYYDYDQIWLLCVHYVFNIISSMLLDRILGD